MCANVDLITKKITGAKPNTLKYFHEEAHLKFEDKCPTGNRIRVAQDLSFRFLVFVVALGLLISNNVRYTSVCLSMPWYTFMISVGIIILLLINILTEIYEELWCNAYARNKMGKKTDDERKKGT